MTVDDMYKHLEILINQGFGHLFIMSEEVGTITRVTVYEESGEVLFD